ncbi:MAG TPA: class I tRNA ligase family protein [Candidatus Sulfomarinibacteraceae bacterium]|nr:class I tRNA ligase family protein [Candidatus Sulfomarinibacteraceae bacterium]
MFRPVPTRPDLVAMEHETLAFWRERRTFAQLRAQNADGPRWSFLDGPITANNPMGVHHAWGRTYKDLFQRFHAMLGEDQRWQNGFDCQGLWVEVNVERDLGFTSKRDIEAYGIAEFVSLCKQRVLTFAARQTEQSIRLGYWMDWNDPDELRRLRDHLAADPSERVTVQGPAGPVTDTVEMIVGRLGMPELGGSYFTFSNENNDLIWGFLAECHRRGWIYKGHDTMPWCARCGTGISQHEMNEGYQDRDDPGLTIRLPLIDRPGESLLVWTTTPWTLTSNVAAAVGPGITYVRVRAGDDELWLGRGTLKTALDGRFEVLEERTGSELVGWRYAGPFDDLPAVGEAFSKGTRDAPSEPYVHRVVAWGEVGEEEGTGIVHIAPGCGAEDYALGRALGLPVIAPLDESGIFVDGFGSLSGRDVRDVTEPIVEHLHREGRFYRLDTYRHRYPHCWRCGTALVFRLVDEWYISMGEVYDQPRETLTSAQVDGSLRYQIMEVVDQIRWIPGFGYERELDWLLNMHDWMISKKRYWGLALPIWVCADCGEFDVLGGRDELRERAVEGWDRFEGHTPHRPYVDEVAIACRACGGTARRVPDVGNPWLDAGIVPFSTLHYREDPDYWAKWFPADFISESFPGQFRNWFYAMLAMSTVLRREPPFRTIFGYATLFGEDGRPMHKSWGNSIEFDEAAERMGVDVMRWLYMSSRPDDNILFGWHAADEARRRLLVLWNVYAFFVSYARLAGWTPGPGDPPPAERAPMDRWILSRSAALAAGVEDRLRDYDAMSATQLVDGFIDDLSTWYLRLSRRRFSRGGGADRAAAFATLHAVLVAVARVSAPILPFLADELYRNLVTNVDSDAPHSAHLTRYPTAELAGLRDERLEAAMATARRAVDLARTLRGTANLKVRQPLARLWLALPGGDLHELDALVTLIADEVNVKAVELIGDESSLVERRVKVLLPKVGKRLGPAIPSVVAAARDGAFEIRADGSVALAGVILAPDEVEILATPRPGTAVAHDEGLVVVIDTALTAELRAEGDARELQRAIQDLRKEAALELDDEVDLVVDGLEPAIATHLDGIAAETLAVLVSSLDGGGITSASVTLEAGPVRLALRRRDAASGAGRA